MRKKDTKSLFDKSECITLIITATAFLWAYIAVSNGVTDGRAIIGFVALVFYALAIIIREMGV